MHQKLTLIGFLGGDPELRSTSSGQWVANFSVATKRQWTSADGEKQEETTWFKVAAWGKMGENCARYLSKGRQVFVEGRLNQDRAQGGPRVWQDQSGNYRASFEMTAFDVKFLGAAGEARQIDPQQGEAPLNEDEIPF